VQCGTGYQVRQQSHKQRRIQPSNIVWSVMMCLMGSGCTVAVAVAVVVAVARTKQAESG